MEAILKGVPHHGMCAGCKCVREGHDVSRAVRKPQERGLSPLRDVCRCSAPTQVLQMLRADSFRKTQMRLRPATRAASFVDLESCHSRREVLWDDGTGPTALQGVPHLPVLIAAPNSRKPAPKNKFPRTISLQPLQSASSPPAPKSGHVEEAAMPPGNRFCAHARSNFPRQFTLENCRLPPASPQIVVQQASRIATYSLNPLCGRLLRAATKKHFLLVQKL